MDGFRELVNWVLVENGLESASIYVKDKRELPSFFRPTKDWGMLVVHDAHLVAALEFKSQRGPSSETTSITAPRRRSATRMTSGQHTEKGLSASIGRVHGSAG